MNTEKFLEEFIVKFVKELMKDYLNKHTDTEIKELKTVKHGMKYDKENQILYQKFLVNNETLIEIEEVCEYDIPQISKELREWLNKEEKYNKEDFKFIEW